MRTSLTTRRIAAVAVAPLLLAGLASCGPGDSSADSKASASTSSSPSGGAASDASDGATPSEAASTDGAASTTGGGTIDPKQFAADLAAGFDASTTATTDIKVTSAGTAMSATGAVDYTGDSPSMAMKMSMPSLGSGQIDMRLIGSVMYISMPMLDSSGKFFKIDLNDPSNPLGDSVGDLSSFDPQSTLKLFSKNVSKVVLVGPDTVDGTQTEHYRVTASGKGLADSLGGATGGATLPKSLTYDIWLDGDKRMRKMTADLGKSSSMEMQMSGWGDPVEISAPPASQVQKLPGS